MKNRQFYIYKFNSTYLKDNNFKIDLDYKSARANKQIIAVSDSQMLRSIRQIQGRDIDRAELESLFIKRDEIKKQPNSKINNSVISKMNKEIHNILFVPEYISVVIDNKQHYKKMYANGFYLNGICYRRFSCSAPQARVSTVIFVSEEIYGKLKAIINNDRIDKPLVPAKYNAYFGLASSSTQQVRDLKFCVVKDAFMVRPTLVNWVTEQYGDCIDDTIEQKYVDIEYNLFDGMGLITPKGAELWANDLGLDYIPSQFCIRHSYIKGMVCIFDIIDFCEKKNNNHYIIDTIYKDNNGEYIKADLREIDLILTESQFKLWSSYDGLDDYLSKCCKNNLTWGISKYSAKHDSNNLFLNYQSIQTLKLDHNDIIELCEPTVSWLKGVSYSDPMYATLFLLGKYINDRSLYNYLQSSDNYWLKSMLLDNELLNDRYINNKIYDSISKKISNACLGRILVKGNYQTMISDPYALMEHVCGLKVVGLLKDKEHYSAYWNRESVSQVDSMRSPLTYKSEHNILNFNPTPEQMYWYRYNTTGIVYNVWGDDVLRSADSDFDMDQIATTNNDIVLKGVYRDLLPVTVAKKSAEKVIITDLDLFNADIQAFGSEIGSITNKSTTMYTMLSDIKDSSQTEEIEKRLILSRIAQGNAID